MKDFKLKIEDIKITNEDALDLFYSGMKSRETKMTMGGNFQRFLVDVCQDIFDGDINKRARPHYVVLEIIIVRLKNIFSKY